MTKKALQEQFGTDPGAKVWRLIQGKANPEDSPAVLRWLAQCHYKPSRAELIMEAVNEAISGFGVGSIEGNWVDRYHQNIQACYVIMGDTYDMTVLCDNVTGRFRLTTWGDWFEQNEKKRGLH
jgi:hypothetical protein